MKKKTKQNQFIYQAIIPTKMPISLTEKGLFIPLFWEESYLPFFETFPKMNLLIFPFLETLPKMDMLLK